MSWAKRLRQGQIKRPANTALEALPTRAKEAKRGKLGRSIARRVHLKAPTTQNIRRDVGSETCLLLDRSGVLPTGLHASCIANVAATVQVNNQPVYRRSQYFWKEVTTNNADGSVWAEVTVTATLGNDSTSTSGHVFVPKTPETFTYDADGNLLSDGRWNYTWDAENRLIEMTSHATGPSASRKALHFGYDWQGRRISKVVSNWTGSAWVRVLHEKYVYDGWNLLAVLDGTNNALLKSFLWGTDLSGSLQGAGGVGGLLAIGDVASGNTHFVAYDGNGNVMALVQASDGTASAAYEYGPFGENIRRTGAVSGTNPFRFSTKYQDDETDLLYYGHRYLNVTRGGWPSRDPIEEYGGINLYGFVRNDPISDFDALGKLSRQECLDKLRGLKTHIKEVKDHFSPNHCAAIRAALELFENSPCQKWAGSLDSELQDVIDVFNQFCKPGMKERKLPIPKICERCVEPKRSNVGKWIAVGALCTAGTAIIIFDIVTVPSGEGAFGVVLIRYACAL